MVRLTLGWCWDEKTMDGTQISHITDQHTNTFIIKMVTGAFGCAMNYGWDTAPLINNWFNINHNQCPIKPLSTVHIDCLVSSKHQFVKSRHSVYNKIAISENTWSFGILLACRSFEVKDYWTFSHCFYKISFSSCVYMYTCTFTECVT